METPKVEIAVQEDPRSKLGKLIRSLKEKCPDCGIGGMQLRAWETTQKIEGEDVLKKIMYHYCIHCEYEKEIKNDKFSKKRDWKPVEFPEEPEPVRKWVKKEFSKDKKDGISDYSKPKYFKKS